MICRTLPIPTDIVPTSYTKPQAVLSIHRLLPHTPKASSKQNSCLTCFPLFPSSHNLFNSYFKTTLEGPARHHVVPSVLVPGSAANASCPQGPRPPLFPPCTPTGWPGAPGASCVWPRETPCAPIMRLAQWWTAFPAVRVQVDLPDSPRDNDNIWTEQLRVLKSEILRLKMLGKSSLFKVILLGDGGVGKSSLMNRYVSHKFDTQLFHTIGVEFLNKDLEVDGHFVTIQIWDTAGQEWFRSLRTPFYRGSDCCLLTFSVDDSQSFQNLSNWKK